MNLLELIRMLELFPLDTPILNCPAQGHLHQGREAGLAFVQGRTHYDQQPASTACAFLEQLTIWRGRSLHGRSGDVKIADQTPIFIVDHMHQAGTKVKGLLFTTSGVRFVPEDFF